MWTQVYDPLNSWPLSTAVASLPVVVLLGLIASGKASAWQSALAGLITAMIAAVFVFTMPATMVLAAAGYGVVFAVFRIVWLIVAAVFLYQIAVQTGQFDVMKASIAQLSGDRRIQAILIAFCFGAFIEGAAGFGAPVAITAAFLVGLGFRPFQAAVLCLIANTAPVAWGSVGIPLRTLANVTGLDVEALSATSGRILPPLSFLIPFWLVRTMVGWKETFAVWPALLVTGGTFAIAQFAWSNFVSFELVDIVSAVASLGACMILLKFWKPKAEWRFPEDGAVSPAAGDVEKLKAGRVLRAWMPFAILSIVVMLWGIPVTKSFLTRSEARLGNLTAKPGRERSPDNARLLAWKEPVAGLHLKVAKGKAVTDHDSPTDKDREAAFMDIVPVSATGSAVFLAAILSGFLLGLGPVRMARILAETVGKLVPAMAAIVAMLALGYVTKYSGMDAVLGLAFTRTGAKLYPIFGTLLGWLGVALTGSDTSSNVLFGNLQKITAQKLGLNPYLMASANTTGGVMGKMIDAQSIVVAAAATGEANNEGKILRAVIWHSLILALMVGAIVWVYAHLLPDGVVMPRLRVQKTSNLRCHDRGNFRQVPRNGPPATALRRESGRSADNLQRES